MARYTSTVEREVGRENVVRRVGPAETRARAAAIARGDDVEVAVEVDTLCAFVKETHLHTHERTTTRGSSQRTGLLVMVAVGGAVAAIAGLAEESECETESPSSDCGPTNVALVSGAASLAFVATAFALSPGAGPGEEQRTRRVIPTGAGTSVCRSRPWAGALVEWVGSDSVASAATRTDSRGKARFPGALAGVGEGDVLVEGQLVAHVRRGAR